MEDDKPMLESRILVPDPILSVVMIPIALSLSLPLSLSLSASDLDLEEKPVSLAYPFKHLGHTQGTMFEPNILNT